MVLIFQDNVWTVLKLNYTIYNMEFGIFKPVGEIGITLDGITSINDCKQLLGAIGTRRMSIKTKTITEDDKTPQDSILTYTIT